MERSWYLEHLRNTHTSTHTNNAPTFSTAHHGQIQTLAAHVVARCFAISSRHAAVLARVWSTLGSMPCVQGEREQERERESGTAREEDVKGSP
jgi:hypothetical protein